MINNNFLEQIADAMAGSSYSIPTHLAFGSTVIVPAAGDSVLSGEFGNRYSVSKTPGSNVVTYSGIRIGADVASSSGEYLNGLALFTSSSGGLLMANEALSSILHTTAYDIAVDYEVTFSRG